MIHTNYIRGFRPFAVRGRRSVLFDPRDVIGRQTHNSHGYLARLETQVAPAGCRRRGTLPNAGRATWQRGHRVRLGRQKRPLRRIAAQVSWLMRALLLAFKSDFLFLTRWLFCCCRIGVLFLSLLVPLPALRDSFPRWNSLSYSFHAIYGQACPKPGDKEYRQIASATMKKSESAAKSSRC